jgi:hypothetical protein
MSVGILIRRWVLLFAVLFTIALPRTALTHGSSTFLMAGAGSASLVSGPGLTLTGMPTTSTYSMTPFSVYAVGVLAGHAVDASSYNCQSTFVLTGSGYNASLEWQFSCSMQSSTGPFSPPRPIVGDFNGPRFPHFNGTLTAFVNGVNHGRVRTQLIAAFAPTVIEGGHIRRLTWVAQFRAIQT